MGIEKGAEKASVQIIKASRQTINVPSFILWLFNHSACKPNKNS